VLEVEGDYFVVWKNPELKPVDVMMIKNVKVEWGEDEEGRLKIRRLMYPRGEYSRRDVERIMEETLSECRFCNVGYLFKEKEKSLLGEKKSRNDEGGLNVELTSILDKVTKNPTASIMYGGALLTGLMEIPLDMFLTALGSKMAKGVAAVLAGIGAYKTSGRISDELMMISASFAKELLDPDPEKLVALKTDVEKLVKSIQYGSYDGVADALVRNPNEVVRKVKTVVPSEVKVPKMGKVISDAFSSVKGEFQAEESSVIVEEEPKERDTSVIID